MKRPEINDNNLHEEMVRLRAVNAELLAACVAAREAIAAEWLYQTGQTVRPQANYPPQGTMCWQLSKAMVVLIAAIEKTEGATT